MNRDARLAGLLYLILLPTTGVWYAMTSALLASGDLATTLAGVAAGRTRLEIAIVAGAFGFVDFLILGVVVYRLLRPAGKTAAGVLLAFVVASSALSLAAVARQMDVLSLLDAAGFSTSAKEQIPLQVTMALRGASNLFLITDVFSGLWLIPLGWLGMRAGVLPRAIGYALIAGSAFYVLTFVGTVVDPAYATTLFARVLGIISGVPGFLGELGTIFWLLIKAPRVQIATVAAAQPAGSLSDL